MDRNREFVRKIALQAARSTIQTLQLRLAYFILLSSALTGCALFDSQEARVKFSFAPYADIDHHMLTMTFSDGKRVWNLQQKDFQARSDRPDAVAISNDFDTASSGRLQVDFALISAKQVVTAGSFGLALRPDWLWQVDFLPGPAGRNPVRGCFGCAGSVAFPIAPGYGESAGDSLYVVWGGNSIKNPVIY